MLSVQFTIPGRIAGKGRHRSFILAGKIAQFTPKKTESHEAIVRQLGALGMRGKSLMQGPLRMEIFVQQVPPESWSNKKRQHALYITGKPDCDNVLKLIADALNGVVYKDDSQIAELRFSRRYRLSGTESVSVRIEELEESK